VERFGKTQKEALTINENSFNQFQIQSGDYFKVENIADRIKNRVSIKGAVYFEGDYSLDEIKTLKQLIGKVKLKEEAFLQRGLIKRLQENYQPLAIAFNLKDILSGKENITLQREDEVSIFSIGQTKESYTVSINGEINNPGTYNLSDSLQVEDLVLMAGGFKESANPRRIEIARRIRDKAYDGDTSQLSIVQIIEIKNDLTISPNIIPQ
jgi:DMSO/TMAO reductase YedYZ molybdopterin-dependent catalytic subunit